VARTTVMKWMATAIVAIAVPAHADVKAGVDAASRGDYEAAIAEWRGPAQAGDADAQFNMGQSYKLGRGVPADQAAAVDWFRKAAAQGHAQAGDQLGLLLYQRGDHVGALPWLEKAAARDEKRGELVLGTMLFNGDKVTRDWPRAYALVTRSAAQGVPQARATLTQMEQHLSPAEQEQGRALAMRIEAQGRGATPTSPAVVAEAPVQVAQAPARAAPVPTRPAPRPEPEPVRASAAASGGAWKVQLGVFRDAGNARAMWAQKGARVGGSPAYVKAGALTKLLATGFASKADAQRACAKVGECLVTR
jgi:uncharacterized protein